MKNILKIGASFSRPLEAYNNDGTAFDLTDHVVVAELFSYKNVLIDTLVVQKLSTTNIVNISATSVDTSTYPVGASYIKITASINGVVVITQHFPLQIEY